MQYIALVVAGDDAVLIRKLPERGKCEIGSTSECDIALAAADGAVHHAVLTTGDDVQVEVLKGEVTIRRVARIDGVPRHRETPLPLGRPMRLQAGDCLALGSTLVIVHREKALGAGNLGFDAPLASGQPVRAVVHPGLVAHDPRMRALLDELQIAARSELNVLLWGETGVGKEVFAEMVHQGSPRARGPQVRLNCAAFSESLFEAELFGYEAGAFTGALRAKPGLLEIAQGGTVFLDEVSEMPLALQAKMLRVLDERCVWRVGALRGRPIDVRFIAATNRDLQQEVQRGHFRQDLLFRLHGMSFRIPSLRERRLDIVPLALHFAQLAYAKAQLTMKPSFSRDALDRLEQHAWIGNVRELRNVVERAVLLAGAAPILPHHLRLESIPGSAAGTISFAEDQQGSSERGIEASAYAEGQRIRAALELCAGNQTAAAAHLGISRRTLVYKLDRYGFSRPRKPTGARHRAVPRPNLVVAGRLS